MSKIWIMACLITSSVCAQTISIGPLAKGLPSFSVTSTPSSTYNNLFFAGGAGKLHIPDLFLPIDFSLHVLYGKKLIIDREPRIIQGNPTFTTPGFSRSISNLEVGIPITYQLVSSVITIQAGLYFAFDRFTITEVSETLDPWGNLSSRSEDEFSTTKLGFWPVAELSTLIVSALTIALFAEYRLSEFAFDYPDASVQTGMIHYDSIYKLNGFQLGCAVLYSF